MKVLLDTNILFDVLGHREPFYRASADVWALAEARQMRGYISAISHNNIYYIVRNLEGPGKARAAIRLMRDVFDAVGPDVQIINQAIDSGIKDFEDAIQFHSAVRIRANCIVTRNPGDFPRNAMPIQTPDEFWQPGIQESDECRCFCGHPASFRRRKVIRKASP